MEQWKTMEGYDGVFSISNTMKILRSEHMTIGEFGGKQFPVRAKEELFEGLEEVSTEYKGKHLLFNMLQEAKKYFTKEEIQEGKEILEKQMKQAAKEFDFERAAEIRDIILEIKSNL
jgi:protein-arginine kinase activator protein McsA